MKLAHVNSKRFAEYQPYIDTLVLPIGTIEAHGPHAPLGTDVIIPKKLAERIEQQLSGRIWTAPEISYGHCFHLREFPGTIDVPARVFADYVYAVVASFARWGLKNVVLLNGHGGNIASLGEVANRLTELGLHVLVSNYWVDYREAIAAIAPGVGHAGEDETSLVLAADPTGVELELAGEANPIHLPRVRYPGLDRDLYPDGYSGDPAQATAEKGERLLELLAFQIVNEITSMWKQNS